MTLRRAPRMSASAASDEFVGNTPDSRGESCIRPGRRKGEHEVRPYHHRSSFPKRSLNSALVITRRRSSQLASALLSQIEASGTIVVPVTEDDQAHARALLERHRDKLYSLTDALSFVVMERLGITRVFTFDHNFEHYGFTILTPDRG